MRIGLLKEFLLVFLFTRFNIACPTKQHNYIQGCGTNEYDLVEVTVQCRLNNVHLHILVHGVGKRVYSISNNGKASINVTISNYKNLLEPRY